MLVFVLALLLKMFGHIRFDIELTGKNLLRGKYHLDGKLTSNIFPHISAVIDVSKGTIKKISPQLHGTDAKKRREKPFNQYFIDQLAGFC